MSVAHPPRSGKLAVANDLFSTQVPQNHPKPPRKIQLIKFDPELYNLALKIFLANKNLSDAFAIAFSAVKQKPDSYEWRKQLATISVWAQQPLTALDQYLYLAKHFEDMEAFHAGMKLSKGMHEDQVLVDLITLSLNKGNTQTSVWQEYIDASLRLGEPERAATQIRKHSANLPPKFYLPNLIRIYDDVDDITSESQALSQYDRMLGVTPFSAHKQAAIAASHADYETAMAYLRAARPKARAKDLAYWEFYAQLANITNHKPEALHAYQQVAKLPKPPADVMIELHDLTVNTNPAQAYKYATRGKNLYPDNLTLLQDSLSSAAFIGRWHDILTAWPRIPAVLKRELNLDPGFWSLKSNLLEQIGDHQKAAANYRKAIDLFPEDPSLKSEYLSLLLHNSDNFHLVSTLPLWQKQLCVTPELWSTYAIVYAHQANRAMSQAIINLYYQQMRNYQHDPYWLIAFQDLLENTGHSNEALMIRMAAWPMYLRLLAQQKDPADHAQILNYVRLSSDLEPGDPTAIALKLLEQTMTPDVAEIIFSWALSQRNYALANAAYQLFLANGWQPPPQLTLTLALYQKDRYLQRQMLTQHAEVLPPEDRVQAAQEIDAIRLAQTLAYKNLAEQPNNSDLYDNYFVPIMLSGSDHIDLKQQYYQYGPVEGPRSEVSITSFLTPSISLTPYGSIWWLKDIDPTSIATVPGEDARFGLKTKIQRHRGDLMLDLGYRDNFKSFFTAKLTRDYLIRQNLSALFTLGYHQEALDSTALYIAGMKNNAQLDLQYSFSARDSFQAQYSQNVFYAQGGQYLSNGQQETLIYKHQFWQKYPDWSIGGYGTAAQYWHKTANFPADALILVPTETLANAAFFIPQNFVEYGATVEFGENFRKDYTHNWRPFASYTLSNSTTANLGHLYDFGIAGSVFGKDHLSLFFQEGMNQVAGVNRTRLLEIMYQFYY